MITMAEALSTARALMVRISNSRHRHAVILKNGETAIRILSDVDEIRPAWVKPPSKLVGVYRAGANLQDVAEDIIATDQGEYATRRIRR